MIDPSSKSDCCGHPVQTIHEEDLVHKICTKCGEECVEVNPDPELEDR
jgi:hypothetical protein